MKGARTVVAAAVIVAAGAAGCGGGGGSATNGAPALPNGPASSAKATTTMTLAFPKPAKASQRAVASARAPRYVSTGTRSFALFDGPAEVYVGNIDLEGYVATDVYDGGGPTSITGVTCAPGSNFFTCTFTVSTTAGPHAFDIQTYSEFQGNQKATGRSRSPFAARRPAISVAPSSSPSPAASPLPFALNGYILSEGELAVTLAGGTNQPATLHLLGVAFGASFEAPSEVAYNDTATIDYEIDDASSDEILQPNPYDNGPVTITASPPGIVTFTPLSLTTPPADSTTQSFQIQCTGAAGGTVTFTANAGAAPSATYASGLAYSSSNYATPPLGSVSVTCAALSGTVPITLESRGRR